MYIGTLASEGSFASPSQSGVVAPSGLATALHIAAFGRGQFTQIDNLCAAHTNQTLMAQHPQANDAWGWHEFRDPWESRRPPYMRDSDTQTCCARPRAGRGDYNEAERRGGCG